MIYLDGLRFSNQLLPLSWRWHRLVHVYRRWRPVVFASPNFLDLRLFCHPTRNTRVGHLHIWPSLPIVLSNLKLEPSSTWVDFDFGAVMVHHNRICAIDLFHLTNSQLRRLTSGMQRQFPALTHLALSIEYNSVLPAPTLPDGFLGGSAPRLQFFKLRYISFPALQKLLLSATDLVRLELVNVSYSEYTSFETIVPGLAMLVNLKRLVIQFDSPRSRPVLESQLESSPLPTRIVLPALTRLTFGGITEYLEGLVTRINAPMLHSLLITYLDEFMQGIPQVARFLRRTTIFETLNEAHVDIDYSCVSIGSLSPAPVFDKKYGLTITCQELDYAPSSVTQVFTSLFPSIYIAEHLYIYGSRGIWERDNGYAQWLDILYPFSAVKNLYIVKEVAEGIASALQELVGEKVSDVLPALESIFLREILPSDSGPFKDAIGPFVAARNLSAHPVVVSRWVTIEMT